MKRYRINKDITNRLRVKTNGDDTPLLGRDISLQLTDPKGQKSFEEFTITDGNVIVFVYYGKRHKYTGTYQLTVWENLDKTGMTAVDCINAFRLVPNTTLEGGEDPEGLDTEVNDLSLNLSTGISGADGVGIESVVQTTTSTEDGGINEITQTLTDGTTAVFQIRNGSKGSQGIQGERGLQGERGEKGEKGDAGEDWIPTQQELASIAQSASALVDVPTKTSDLQNDSGFITISDVPEGSTASSTTPKMDGTASVGTETAFARGDHRHPSDTSKQDTISDLATIRSGAALGATAIQSETDPVFTASPAHGITAAKISAWDAKSDFSGSYNDLSDKPTIPSEVTEQTVSGWGFTKNTGTYSKPSGGIPKTDLASAVQTSLGKADTALQSFTESDPTVPSWAKQSTKPTYTASEVGALPASTTIPSALADLSADSTHRVVTDTEKATWNAKGTYSKPSGGIPASDIASGVIPTVPTTVSSFSNDAHYVASTAITTIVSLTQAQYDALATKDANTLYVIPQS